jgi:transketolase
MQSDTLVSKVSDLGALEAKLAAFGWHVSRCDGHDLQAFSKTLAATQNIHDKPKVIIADTIKGKGVSFMEHTSIDSDVEFYKFHSGAPTEDAYAKAAQELIDAANAKLLAGRASSLKLEAVTRPVAAIQAKNSQRLIHAYSNALLKQARKNPKIVALDADLILDTGLIPFQKEFPERFVECGIAEQDMVSQAGGMALKGLIPIVHSFACFLSSRSNEQLYNNATEKTKIIYVGSLAGVLPGGPGHSHQAIRDIASLGAIPNLVLVEPSCETEVGVLLDWVINRNLRSSYLRLVSIPIDVPYSLPIGTTPILGQGAFLREGKDAILISAGPVTLTAAWHAAELLESNGVQLGIINMPWLNYIDHNWLCKSTEGVERVYCLDNHNVVGGLADTLRRTYHAQKLKPPCIVGLGINGVPPSGMNSEVLGMLDICPERLAQRIATDAG